MAKAKEANPETGVQEVTANVPSIDREIKVNYNFGNSLDDAVELYGEAVVFSQYIKSAKIDLQAVLRRNMEDQTNKAGEVTSPAKTDDEILALVSEWKPGVATRTRKSPQEKVGALLAQMSPEERAALLQQAAEELETVEELETA